MLVTRKNAGYQHLLLFPQCLLKHLSIGSLKVRIVWEKVNGMLKTNNSGDFHPVFKLLGCTPMGIQPFNLSDCPLSSPLIFHI